MRFQESIVYKTDLLKFHKTLFREIERFAKNVKITLQKYLVSQNKNVRSINISLSKKLVTLKMSFSWFPYFANANVIIECCKSLAVLGSELFLAVTSDNRFRF